MERLVPFSPRQIHPEKHQIGSLRIGKSPMNDPGVGIEISAGQRQQADDQQRLLAGKRYGGAWGIDTIKFRWTMVWTEKQTAPRENGPGGGCRLI